MHNGDAIKENMTRYLETINIGFITIVKHCSLWDGCLILLFKYVSLSLCEISVFIISTVFIQRKQPYLMLLIHSHTELCTELQSLSRVQRSEDPMDCSPPGSSVHRTLQARILEWIARPSRGSSQPRDQTQVSRIAGEFFTVWATRETHVLSQIAFQHPSLSWSFLGLPFVVMTQHGLRSYWDSKIPWTGNISKKNYLKKIKCLLRDV